MNTLLTVSIALLAGLLKTRLFKPFKLPAVTAYLIAGVLIGPYCMGALGIEGLGFNSMEFAIVAVFSIIIMYDASGVRRAVGKQAAVLNQIIDDLHHKKHIEQKKLKELVGHTPIEVLFGALLGILTALILG